MDVVSRQDKERVFATTVPLLDSYARQALGEINTVPAATTHICADVPCTTGRSTSSPRSRPPRILGYCWRLSTICHIRAIMTSFCQNPGSSPVRPDL
jgi:hypothetical protein